MTDMGWTASAAAAAAFLASLVEFVEALTVVLAVGAVRGRRGSLTGAALDLATLIVCAPRGFLLAQARRRRRVPQTGDLISTPQWRLPETSIATLNGWGCERLHRVSGGHEKVKVNILDAFALSH